MEENIEEPRGASPLQKLRVQVRGARDGRRAADVEDRERRREKGREKEREQVSERKARERAAGCGSFQAGRAVNWTQSCALDAERALDAELLEAELCIGSRAVHSTRSCAIGRG